MDDTWTARTVRPIVAVGVVAVFLAFMALAWFVFGSDEAVKALAGTGAVALVTLVPSMLARVEYRLTEDGLEKRPVRAREPGEYEALFAWDEVSRVVPTRTGFKYYKEVDASNPVTRAVRLHVLSGYSGAVHVEATDLPRVLAVVEQRLSPALGAGA